MRVLLEVEKEIERQKIAALSVIYQTLKRMRSR